MFSAVPTHMMKMFVKFREHGDIMSRKIGVNGQMDGQRLHVRMADRKTE